MAKVTKKKPATAKKAAPAKAAKAVKKAPVAAPDETRLALDRFLIGIWIDRDLMGFLASKSPAAKPLASLAQAREFDRSREGEKLRKALFGRDRPTEIERFEALLRQGVDCVIEKMPVLAELQHDLLAHTDAVPKVDGRSQAMRAIADYAAVSQVNLAVQDVGRLAVATLDRVANARKDALARLKEALADFPYLRP
ncbi:MAG TPA: hypothetical protein VGK67_30715 [Myxococcales bacterium]|jgi:hypothetical protein